MNLNTEGDNVIYTTITVEEIREEDDTLIPDITSLLDEAQAEVFSGAKEKMYIIIEVNNG